LLDARFSLFSGMSIFLPSGVILLGMIEHGRLSSNEKEDKKCLLIIPPN